jgi:hypothetical protein
VPILLEAKQIQWATSGTLIGKLRSFVQICILNFLLGNVIIWRILFGEVATVEVNSSAKDSPTDLGGSYL